MTEPYGVSMEGPWEICVKEMSLRFAGVVLLVCRYVGGALYEAPASALKVEVLFLIKQLICFS